MRVAFASLASKKSLLKNAREKLKYFVIWDPHWFEQDKHCRPRMRSTVKSACLIVQSLNARVYVHLLADKTAGRIRGRLCSYNSKAQWLSDCLMQVQGISACVINVTVVLYPRYTIFFHLWIAYQRSHSERLNES